VRGVAYGTFAPRSDGEFFPERERVREDFATMAAAGINVVRTYTAPPADLLDDAEEAGLRILAGLHYEDWRYELEPGRRARRRILEAGRRAVAGLVERRAGRTALFAVSVGNEVPADLVRVHGIGGVEDVLSRLIAEVHGADPDLLATYTSFPTTEYLRVEGQDLLTFNVFLERPEQLTPYLRHLQVLSDGLPVVITELGLASVVHGEDAQAKSLAWQLDAVDEAGCAGAVVFSWTDEWAVGGQEVEGWGFGLTDPERRPKPALETVRRWTGSSVRDLRERWPRLSVIVCVYNGDRLLDACLASLAECDYPELEVIVCDDGSTDGTLEVAGRFPFRIISAPRGGLSAARNAGLAASTGEVVAFLDADAQCHPEWPYHLALSLEDENVAATGGPNLPVPEAGFVERAVAASPGGPVEVLVGDDRAEHVPGCNMAFLRENLEEIGGFDAVYTAAGDDVDVCWKLLDRGYEIAFAPAAQVRHHRRASVRAYLRQQRGYGRAERLLSGAHAHRFNGLGQARWRGFVYGGARLAGALLRPRIYHGPMGTAAFQPIVRRPFEARILWLSAYLPALVLLALLAALAPLSSFWLAAPMLAVGALAAYGSAVFYAVRPARGEPRPLAFRGLVTLMHVTQPFVRAWGRLRGPRARTAPRRPLEWTGDRTAWLAALQDELTRRRLRSHPGDEHATWDLAISIGPFVRSQITTAVAWHWEPLFRASLRPKKLLFAGVVGSLALLFVAPIAAAALLAALGVAAALEALLLSRGVRRLLENTTKEARTLAERPFLEDLDPTRASERVRLPPVPQTGSPEGAYD
jgi:O-antigen biosynthesis protein